MSQQFRFGIVIALIALTSGTLACGASAPSQPADQAPVQVMVTEPPADTSSDSGTDSSAVAPCSQLIPPDEVQNLLINLTPALDESAFPGSTSCVWEYTNAAGQSNTFSVQADFTPNALSLWEATRNSELSNEPSDLIVIPIDGLGDESYVWSSKATGLSVVYVRQGERTLIMRFNPQDILFMGTESGIIDMADRIFSRF